MTRTITADAAQTAARMLIEYRVGAERLAARLTAGARAQGHDIDTRIQYAEGSAAAYAIACSVLAGVAGVSIDVLAGEYWTVTPDAMPPMLPDRDAAAFAPGDEIAAATVTVDRWRERDGVDDHG